MSEFQDNIKTELRKKYSLNREPHWYTECIKWAEKTREYINKGLNDEEAGSKAAEDIFPKYIIIEKQDIQITKSFTLMTVQGILDNLKDEFNDQR